MFYLHLCVCATCMVGAFGVQRRHWIILELASCQVHAGNPIWDSRRSSSALNHWDIFPDSFPGDFLYFHQGVLSEISIWILNILDCFLTVLSYFLLSRHYVFWEISPILSFLVQFSFLLACLFLRPFPNYQCVVLGREDRILILQISSINNILVDFLTALFLFSGTFFLLLYPGPHFYW